MQNRKPRNYETRNTIVRYMIQFEGKEGTQPTVREIGKAAGLKSTSTTAGYLERMVREGLLQKGDLARRNYSVTAKALTGMQQAG